MSQFTANYRRYTQAATDLLMRISTALGTIQGARVLPAVADQLRASARAGTVHFSNLIEGNQLPYIEAERATRGELAPDSRAKIELVNYVAALDLIDERIATGTLDLNSVFLLNLHGVITKGLGRSGDRHFEPRHEGAWRDGRAMVVDRLTGQTMHEGPPAVEVPERMENMFEWLKHKQQNDQEPPFILAGVAHYAITDIHPFADGNGRAARLLQTAVLMKAGVLPERMFSFERYYAEDRSAYYQALQSVRKNTFNMEAWLEYFLAGIAEEYERVAATVADLSVLASVGGHAPLQLSMGQERALAGLRIKGRREFTRREYEKEAGTKRTTASKEIRDLIRHGVLISRGTGQSTRYIFSGVDRQSSRAAQGRPKKWTDELIESELRAFLENYDSWPRREEFESAGQRNLYAAASRAGGIRRWRQILGY